MTTPMVTFWENNNKNNTESDYARDHIHEANRKIGRDRSRPMVMFTEQTTAQDVTTPMAMFKEQATAQDVKTPVVMSTKVTATQDVTMLMDMSTKPSASLTAAQEETTTDVTPLDEDEFP